MKRQLLGRAMAVRDTYMMNGEEVVEAARAFAPKVVIPVHWLPAEQSEIDYLVGNAPKATVVRVLEPR